MTVSCHVILSWVGMTASCHVILSWVNDSILSCHPVMGWNYSVMSCHPVMGWHDSVMSCHPVMGWNDSVWNDSALSWVAAKLLAKPQCYATVELETNQKTQDEPQWIVAQGLLSALTIPGFE